MNRSNRHPRHIIEEYVGHDHAERHDAAADNGHQWRRLGSFGDRRGAIRDAATGLMNRPLVTRAGSQPPHGIHLQASLSQRDAGRSSAHTIRAHHQPGRARVRAAQAPGSQLHASARKPRRPAVALAQARACRLETLAHRRGLDVEAALGLRLRKTFLGASLGGAGVERLDDGALGSLGLRLLRMETEGRPAPRRCPSGSTRPSGRPTSLSMLPTPCVTPSALTSR